MFLSDDDSPNNHDLAILPFSAADGQDEDEVENLLAHELENTSTDPMDSEDDNPDTDEYQPSDVGWSHRQRMRMRDSEDEGNGPSINGKHLVNDDERTDPHQTGPNENDLNEDMVIDHHRAQYSMNSPGFTPVIYITDLCTS